MEPPPHSTIDRSHWSFQNSLIKSEIKPTAKFETRLLNRARMIKI